MANVVEKLSLKPNCVGENTLYLFQEFINRFLIIVSKILLKDVRIDIGQWLFGSFFSHLCVKVQCERF